MRLSSFLELIQLLLNRGLFFLRGSRKFFFQALLKLCQSLAGCWVNSNGRIAQHCFGTRGCDCDRFGLTWIGIDYCVTEMPEVSFDDFMKDFIIADGCLQEGVPVDDIMVIVEGSVPNTSAFTLRMKKVLKEKGNPYRITRKKKNKKPIYVFESFNSTDLAE